MSEASSSQSSAILAGLPQPVIVLGRDKKVQYANFAAEEFFSQGLNLLRTRKLEDIIPFGSPLVGLVEEVFRSVSRIN